MDQQLLAALLDKVRLIAHAAGRAILQIAAEDIGVTEKSNGSPLKPSSSSINSGSPT